MDELPEKPDDDVYVDASVAVAVTSIRVPYLSILKHTNTHN